MKIFFLIFLILFAFAIEQDYVIGPHGISVHKSCVHHVTSGSHVRTLDDGSIIAEYKGDIKSIPKCEYPYKFVLNKQRENGDNAELDGWQVWAAFEQENQTSFDVFTDIMSVPPNPTTFTENGIIYLFPVLQYAKSSTGEGYTWAVASWYVTSSSGYLVSDLIEVSPKENIICSMVHAGQGSTQWTINATVQSTGKTTSLTVSKEILITQKWAFITLEVYYLTTCDYYPSAPSYFTQNVLISHGKQITPKWTAYSKYDPTICGEAVNIESPESVTITFS
ncbi:hypothetical protein M0811_07194 [Anaeramoeba ignava]|uniref:Uncharacterized protein n=1 Tax=Anaeramoeba ignava TaxID=1746090 RepID=A0A9Q0RCZ9_ANAIG|nr:hypothetical protein M0811_07194 [Anaeramoeba ignava]